MNNALTTSTALPSSAGTSGGRQASVPLVPSPPPSPVAAPVLPTLSDDVFAQRLATVEQDPSVKKACQRWHAKRPADEVSGPNSKAMDYLADPNKQAVKAGALAALGTGLMGGFYLLDFISLMSGSERVQMRAAGAIALGIGLVGGTIGAYMAHQSTQKNNNTLKHMMAYTQNTQVGLKEGQSALVAYEGKAPPLHTGASNTFWVI
jgi:hypothetical protein